jgi:ssDNA-binding Zn-finger/Zn-ribbon topoisomerase 1
MERAISGNCGLMPAKHGSAATYESGKCRCAECREAGMRARRRQRERRRERVSAGDVSHVQHGTWAAYTTDKCRCPECRKFKSAYMREYQARQRSA